MSFNVRQPAPWPDDRLSLPVRTVVIPDLSDTHYPACNCRSFQSLNKDVIRSFLQRHEKIVALFSLRCYKEKPVPGLSGSCTKSCIFNLLSYNYLFEKPFNFRQLKPRFSSSPSHDARLRRHTTHEHRRQKWKESHSHKSGTG